MEPFLKTQYICSLNSVYPVLPELFDYLNEENIDYQLVRFDEHVIDSFHCGILVIHSKSCVDTLVQYDDPQLKQNWLIVYGDPQFNKQSHLSELQVFPLITNGYSILHVAQLNDFAKDRLQINYQRAHQKRLLQHEYASNQYMHNLKLANYSKVFSMMEDVLKRIAATDATTIVHGETGTGKELVARALHQMSKRSEGSFIPVNCGAFSDELVLSELFGHEKGAFTGAISSQHGLIELADGGTLFLDEIDSLSAKAQVALLRYLQDGEVRRVGGRESFHTNVRVIAATNVDLHEKVKAKEFREDLLFRINIMHVELPPLRERGLDVLYLSQYFLSKLALQKNTLNKALDSEVIQWLTSYPFPGNVRELENMINRAFLLSASGVIQFSDLHLPNSIKHISPIRTKRLPTGFKAARNEVINAFEKRYLHEVMLRVGGNITKAAALALKERRSFTRLLEKHNIQRSQYMELN